MIRLIREDIDKVFIVVKNGPLTTDLGSFVKWLPKNMTKVDIIDRVPDDLKNKARYLLIIHYSVLDRRMSTNISDFIRRYVDQGFLVCYIDERRLSAHNINSFNTDANALKEENIQTEVGIEKKISDMMVDVSYEQGTLDKFGSLDSYLKRLLPTRSEFESKSHS